MSAARGHPLRRTRPASRSTRSAVTKAIDGAVVARRSRSSRRRCARLETVQRADRQRRSSRTSATRGATCRVVADAAIAIASCSSAARCCWLARPQDVPAGRAPHRVPRDPARARVPRRSPRLLAIEPQHAAGRQLRRSSRRTATGCCSRRRCSRSSASSTWLIALALPAAAPDAEPAAPVPTAAGRPPRRVPTPAGRAGDPTAPLPEKLYL